MKIIAVEDAIGSVLAHDLTKIVPGGFKGAAFKKGHIIVAEDIDALKNMGKFHLNVLELSENTLHENDAALKMAKAFAGEGLYMEGPTEGKMSLRALHRGILNIDLDLLGQINSIDGVMLSTLHRKTLVEADQYVAGTRIIPLTIEKKVIEDIEEICKTKSLINISPLMPLKIGVVVTGSEVFEKRIEDKFGPVLVNKIASFNGNLLGIKYAPDDKEEIKKRIEEFKNMGAQLIMAAGGMSVDADDVTPQAITESSDVVVSYGSPVLPGAMFMLAYSGDISILGVPACSMFHKITVLDLVLPRIMAGEKISRMDLAMLGHGGLCLHCDVCRYPVCPFGK